MPLGIWLGSFIPSSSEGAAYSCISSRFHLHYHKSSNFSQFGTVRVVLDIYRTDTKADSIYYIIT